MQASKREDALKGRGLALLTEIAETLKQIQLTQTRVRVQLQAAQLLWPTNEKAAAKLVTDAIEGAKAYLASIDIGEPNYYQNYQMEMYLRRQLVEVIATHYPATDLSYLPSTRHILY